MSLNFAPWEHLSQEERRAWENAAEEKGPRFMGNTTLSGKEFHDQLAEDRLRKEMKGQTY